MATFRTYAEVLRPDHPMTKNYKASIMWRPSRYRPAEIEQNMRAEPGVVLGNILERTGGAFGAGNRSAYLRATLKIMKSIMIADQLREAQAHGQ